VQYLGIDWAYRRAAACAMSEGGSSRTGPLSKAGSKTLRWAAVRPPNRPARNQPVYLDRLDRAWQTRGHGVLVRYADDLGDVQERSGGRPRPRGAQACRKCLLRVGRWRLWRLWRCDEGVLPCCSERSTGAGSVTTHQPDGDRRAPWVAPAAAAELKSRGRGV
jgi:hypothetical protein